MKTSNKILIIYGVLLGIFTLGSLGLNVRTYKQQQPLMQQSLEQLEASLGKPVLIVDSTMQVYLTKNAKRVTMNSYELVGPEVLIFGDTVTIKGGSFLWTGPVSTIIKGGQTIQVPEPENWGRNQISY